MCGYSHLLNHAFIKFSTQTQPLSSINSALWTIRFCFTTGPNFFFFQILTPSAEITL